MEISKIKYIGDLRTESIHIKSGNSVITDAPTDNNGKGEAFSPTDLLCVALASCALTIMGIAAKNHSIKFENAEITISKFMETEPRRVASITLDINMPNFHYSEKEKIILQNAALNCPVAKSLSRDLIQNFIFNYPI